MKLHERVSTHNLKIVYFSNLQTDGVLTGMHSLVGETSN